MGILASACLRYSHASIESYVMPDSVFVVFELYLIQMVFRQLALFPSSCGCLNTDICVVVVIVVVVVVPCLLRNFHWKLSGLNPVNVGVQLWRLSDY